MPPRNRTAGTTKSRTYHLTSDNVNRIEIMAFILSSSGQRCNYDDLVNQAIERAFAAFSENVGDLPPVLADVIKKRLPGNGISVSE